MRVLVLPFLLLSSAASAEELPVAPIRNYHTQEILLPACTGEELARLKAASDLLAKSRNPRGAWAVAKAMLCNKDRAPLLHMPALVTQEQYGINEDPGPTYSLVPRDEIEPLRGVAYGANVMASGKDLSYKYNTAGICKGGFDLRLVASKWLIVRVGEACD